MRHNFENEVICNEIPIVYFFSKMARMIFSIEKCAEMAIFRTFEWRTFP